MPSVSHLVITADGGVLLDLKYDRLLKLNAVGAEMWSLMSRGLSEAQVVQNIAQRYGVEPSGVRGDLGSLLRRAQELGLSPRSVLIAESPNQIANSQQQLESFGVCVQNQNALGNITTIRYIIEAFFGFGVFDVIMSCRGLDAVCSIVRSWRVKPAPPTSETTVITQVCQAVEKASVWYPKKALCLQRSAVTTCLLRKHGIPAQMLIGVRPMPFRAHAWVEVQGRVANDFPRVTRFYQSIGSY